MSFEVRRSAQARERVTTPSVVDQPRMGLGSYRPRAMLLCLLRAKSSQRVVMLVIAGLTSLAFASCALHDAPTAYGPQGLTDAGLQSDARVQPHLPMDATIHVADAQLDARVGSQLDADETEDAHVTLPLPTPSGCITDVSAGTHDFACDGVSYHVTVSQACLTAHCGLIVDVHGGTMNALMEELNTQLAALGSHHGFVVIQPDAPNGLWNAATDDAKVHAFISTALSVFRIDPDRVHMTGFSQGGYMTWRFVCKHSELFASVAPAAAAGAAKLSQEVDCPFTGSDVPSRPVPILYMHGTRDALVDFANAKLKRDAVVQAYGLGTGAMVMGDTTYRRTRYASSSNNKALFEFIDHDYASSSLTTVGHCYPGSKDLDPPPLGRLMTFGCVPPNGFTWGETVLQFFIDHPR